MEVGVLSVRYARAFAEYAKEHDAFDYAYKKCMLVLQMFKENKTLSATLEDPLLPKSDKMALLAVAAACSEEKESVLSKFFELVLDHRREGYFQNIMRCFIDIYRHEHDIAGAHITTAVPLDEKMERRIMESSSSLLNKKLELTTSVDPTIEGGFILDVDNQRLDASVATCLKKIRRAFMNNNKRIV